MDRLKVFWAVAAELSFSRAAEKLFRTQSAVSQAIRLLEREIGDSLFVRLGRTIALTPAGHILFEHVEDSFGILERGKTRIQALRELREGQITISASDTITRYVLPKTLSEFRQRYPGVEVRISNRPSTQAAEQVAAHESDIGIVTLPIDHPRLAAEPLQAREDVVICAAGHTLVRRATMRLAELAAYPLILLDQGSATRSYVDTRLAAAGLKPRIAMELGSVEVIKRMVELDFGVSIVPKMAVDDELARGALHTVRIFKRNDWRVIGIVYPKKGITNFAAEAFVALLRKTVSS